jgi:hypothetical protein
MTNFALSPTQPCDNPYRVEYAARHAVKAVEGGWSWKFDPAVFTGEMRDPNRVDKLIRGYANLPVRNAYIHGNRGGQFTPALH